MDTQDLINELDPDKAKCMACNQYYPLYKLSSYLKDNVDERLFYICLNGFECSNVLINEDSP